MATVGEAYQVVKHLDVGQSKPRKIRIRVPSQRHVQALYAVIAGLVVTCTVFGWLAVRNARPLVCDDITTDMWGNKVCGIIIK